MAFRRRTYRRRRSKRKGRTYKRKSYKARRRMYRASQVHHYRRFTSGATITGNAVYAPFLSVADIKLQDVQAPGEFTGLYDQYRINFVVFKFYMKIDPGAQAAGASNIPRLFWYRDFDDSNVPASLDEMRENSKCKMALLTPNRPVTIKVRPNVLNQVYNSAVTVNYEPKWKTWLDCTAANTPHYCFKYAIDDLTNTNYRINIERKVYFSCRQPR